MVQFLIWLNWISTSGLGAAFLLGCNLSLLVLNTRLYRRWRRLDYVLFRLATDAWMMRHLPIWVAWSEMTQVNFKVDLVPREARRS
jgi:hypothetical protein